MNERAGKFHPSSITKCLNQQLCEFYGVPKVVEQESQDIFDLGHRIHGAIQTIWQKNNLLNACEVPVFWPEYTIGGSVDGIGTIDNKPYVLEIKSINVYGFLRELPQHAHIHQVSMYMHLLKIPQSLVLYVNKSLIQDDYDLINLGPNDFHDGSRFRLMKYDYNFDVIMDCMKILSTLNYYAQNKMWAPNCTYNSLNKDCKYCSYSQYCKENIR